MPKVCRRAAAKRHAIERARQRYGIRLTDSDVESINGAIRCGFAWLVEDQPKRKSKLVIACAPCGTALPVIYTHKFDTIITVLPSTSKPVLRALKKCGGFI